MIFLNGETIDLHVPDEQDFAEWASWFNDQHITRFLDHGAFPNTAETQKLLYEKWVKEGRLILLIKSKCKNLLGVISASDICFKRKICQVSYVCPIKNESAPHAAIEALAFFVTHLFENLGMSLIYSGHAYPGLKKWIEKTELIGFQFTGYFPGEYIKGHNRGATCKMVFEFERYNLIKRRRNGSIWPGAIKFGLLLQHYPRQIFPSEALKEAYFAAYNDFDEELHKFETDNL